MLIDGITDLVHLSVLYEFLT